MEKEKNNNNDNINDNEFNELFEFGKFIKNLKDTKLEFLLQINNFDDYPYEEKEKDFDSDFEENNNLSSLQYNKNTQEIIDSIFTFLKSDFLETKFLMKKINYQNAKALNKESFLILFNFLLSIIKGQEEIQDLLHWLNLKYKDSNFIIDFNKDLYGSDPKLMNRVYEKFSNFIFILIQKLKENELQNKEISNNKENNKEKNTEIILQNSKSNLSTLGLISILQSLIWKIKKVRTNILFFIMRVLLSYRRMIQLLSLTLR